MMKKICWLLIAALIAAPLAASSDSEKKKPKAVSITKFIPGVRQLKTKQYVKGTLLLGSFIGAAAAALTFNKKGNDWYDKYRASTNVEEIVLFRKNTEKNLKKRNLFIAGIFSVWLLHILDLKFFKSKKSGIEGRVSHNEINIGIYYRF